MYMYTSLVHVRWKQSLEGEFFPEFCGKIPISLSHFSTVGNHVTIDVC